MRWCFTALWHFSCHFGRGQLTYPHYSWATLLGSLPVLSTFFASNWQLSFLNQQKGENGRRNYFMINLHGRMLPGVRIEPADAHPTELPRPAWLLANNIKLQYDNCKPYNDVVGRRIFDMRALLKQNVSAIKKQYKSALGQETLQFSP